MFCYIANPCVKAIINDYLERRYFENLLYLSNGKRYEFSVKIFGPKGAKIQFLIRNDPACVHFRIMLIIIYFQLIKY